MVQRNSSKIEKKKEGEFQCQEEEVEEEKLEIVEDRTNLSSLIITSQLPIKSWHAYLHNPTIADAILDRVIHNAYKINLEGESQRKLNNQK
ncbi:MAG TPA: hypothetical protein ENK91_00695 [Bacteroidetes bacterium]|nr:hypothetical protein [Bacteroidota bacterium]